MSRAPSSWETLVVLGILLVFSALAVASYVISFVDPSRAPNATLAGIATAVVGAAATHLIIERRKGDGG